MSDLFRYIESAYPDAACMDHEIIHSVNMSKPGVITRTRMDCIVADDPDWDYLYYNCNPLVIVIPLPEHKDWFIIEIYSDENWVGCVVAANDLGFHRIIDYLDANIDKLNSRDEEFMIHLCSSITKFARSLDDRMYDIITNPVMVKSANH